MFCSFPDEVLRQRACVQNCGPSVLKILIKDIKMQQIQYNLHTNLCILMDILLVGKAICKILQDDG